jgi:hypothetical protein
VILQTDLLARIPRDEVEHSLDIILVFLKQQMLAFKSALLTPVAPKRRIGGVGHYERVQDRTCCVLSLLIEAILYVFYRRVEADLGILLAVEPSDALRVDEGNALRRIGRSGHRYLPHDEVRVEVAGFEEAYAPASGHVPQQIKFLIGERDRVILEVP